MGPPDPPEPPPPSQVVSSSVRPSDHPHLRDDCCCSSASRLPPDRGESQASLVPEPHGPAAPAVKIAPSTPLNVKSAELGGPTWDKHGTSSSSAPCRRDAHPSRAPRCAPLLPRLLHYERNGQACLVGLSLPGHGRRRGRPQCDNQCAPHGAGSRRTRSCHWSHRSPGRVAAAQLRRQQAYGCAFDWQADKDLPAARPATRPS